MGGRCPLIVCLDLTFVGAAGLGLGNIFPGSLPGCRSSGVSRESIWPEDDFRLGFPALGRAWAPHTHPIELCLAP